MIRINTVWNVSKQKVIFGPYFPTFGLNMEVFSPNVGKQRPEKTSYLNTFYSVDAV